MAAQFASYPQLTIEEATPGSGNPLVSTPAEDGAMGRGTMGRNLNQNQKNQNQNQTTPHNLCSVQLS